MPMLPASQRWRFNAALPWLVLLVGMGLTLLASHWQRKQTEQQTKSDFHRIVTRIADDLDRRMRGPIYGMRGAAGLYAANHGLDRARFNAYVTSRDLPREFPGVRGFGFIQRVERDEMDEFIARERADGAPDFKIRQLKDTTHPDLYVIKYLEPSANNQGAQGLDVGSESVRRMAAEEAVRSGEPTLSGAITLVQDARKTPGFLLYVPLYRKGSHPVTPAQRKTELVGLLYAPIVAREMFSGVAQAQADLVRFELIDPHDLAAENSSTGATVFSSFNDELSAVGTPASRPVLSAQSNEAVLQHRGRVHESQTLTLAGRNLTLRSYSTPAFEASRTTFVAGGVLVLGTLLSILLAMFVRQQQRLRQHAEATALDMTTDLDRLALVAQRTSNVVIITDRDLRITWVNEGFSRLYGYSAQEALGRTPGDLLGHPDTPHHVLQTLKEAADAGVGCRVEIINRRKTGEAVYVDTEVQPTWDDQDSLIGFVEIASDITAGKRQEMELSKERHAMANIIEGTGAGTWEWNIDTREVVINERWAAIVGHSREELAPTTIDSWSDLVHPDDHAPIRCHLMDHLHGKTPLLECEVRMKHKSGQWIWVVIRGRVVEFKEGGRASRLAGTQIDISQRKQAEAKAEQSAALLRGAVDVIDEGFALFDPQDRLVFFNEKYRQIYADAEQLLQPGVRFEDAIRSCANQGTYSDAIGRVDEWVAERMEVHLREKSTLIQKLENGRTLRVVECKMPDGHIVGFRIDISELVQATEAAQAASAAKSQFLANMSHEIRTPMNAILGMLKLLRRTDLDTRQADYAAKTEGAARGLLGLLNDILDFSKIEAGKMMLDPRPFKLDEFLRDLSVIVQGTLVHKALYLRFDIDPTLPRHLVGDSMRLQQVLTNLVCNAIKFTAVGGVVLSMKVLAQDAATVKLEVSVLDTGIGISPENQSRIFSGFTQAEASVTRRFGGTGLGVAISQRFVSMMGGQLQLESALGAGSRFYFCITLPVAAENALDEIEAGPDHDGPAWTESPASLDGSTRRAPSRLAGLRLLVVEDNPNNQQIARELLEGEGASVQIASDGKQGVDAVAAAHQLYDAVLMDIQMPVMDGLTATALIRQTLGPDVLPIIAMTANAMPGDREDCLSAGMNEHVGKPFDLDHLVGVLRMHCGQPALAAGVPSVASDTLPASVRSAASMGGVQIDAAINRLGGRTDLYRRTLQTFLADLTASTDLLNTLAETGDSVAMARLLHTVKGTAGTLGFDALKVATASAEHALQTHVAPPGTDPQPNGICKQVSAQATAAFVASTPDLQRVLDAMETSSLVADPRTPDSDARESASHGSLLNDLGHLAGLLRQSDMSAVDAVAALPRFIDDLPDAPLRRLETLVAGLEFESALCECERLMETLQAS